MAAIAAEDGQPHLAPRPAAIPPAKCRCADEAADEAEIAGKQGHALVQRIAAANAGEFVEEAFGEEGQRRMKLAALWPRSSARPCCSFRFSSRS